MSENERPFSERERDLLDFLQASGINLTDERVEEALRFNRRVEAAAGLSQRLVAAFPSHTPAAAERKARQEAGDGNVVRYNNEDGSVEYRLIFTDEQRAELVRRYLETRPIGRDDKTFDPSWEAEAFARTVECYADDCQRFAAITPAVQKDRERQLESVQSALERLDKALSGLDSQALAFWYANVADGLAGLVQLSNADGQIVSMLNHETRATVEAGELRQKIRLVVDITVAATAAARDDLPKHDHVANDWRRQTTFAIERLILERGLPFEETETGFAAHVLRAVFDLAGVQVEHVAYWLKEVAHHPDSYARFVQKMRDRV